MIFKPRKAKATLKAGLALVVLVGMQGSAWAADGKLDEIKKRGHMIAGVRIESSRFGALDTKTNEIGMFELGTHQSRLWRSSRNEWFGGTAGFYWGCNNAKDLKVRLEYKPDPKDPY